MEGLGLRPGSGPTGTQEWRWSLRNEPGGCLLLAPLPSAGSGALGSGCDPALPLHQFPKVPLGLKWAPLQTSAFFHDVPKASVSLFLGLSPAPTADPPASAAG